MTDTPETRDEINARLEAGISALVDDLAAATGPVIVTDWVVMVAGVRPAEAGQSTGYWYLPRPHQPIHSTMGLLDYAHAWVKKDGLEDD